MSRDPRPYDAEVLDAAARILRRAHRRREHRSEIVTAAAFLASVLAVGLAALLNPAAPFVVLALLLALWMPHVGRVVDGIGPADPPDAERIPRSG